MMKRNVYNELLQWKVKKNRKPLLITGVRQCGKTYIIKEFGVNEFDNMAYLNFDADGRLNSIFEKDYDVNRIVMELSNIILECRIEPGKTLLVFDEIQVCPRAIESLKYFCENLPELHIIGAGSLLGVAMNKKGISFPVGKIDRIEMHPMSFEEFVIADCGEKYIDGILQYDIESPLSEIYTEPLEMYLKNYYIVGGMPEAVASWCDEHDYQLVEQIQDNILNDYNDDFGKYAEPDMIIKMRLIWNSIPVQIARENNKFVFGHVKTGGRARDLEDALQWLINAGLVYKLPLVSYPEIPLSGVCDETNFKIYMADVGLLRRKSNINYRTILEGDKSFIHFKGALTENYVMNELVCQNMPTYFWKSNSDAEIDFLTDYEGVLMPIEVKSADNTKAKSLKQFCMLYKPKIAIKTSLKNIGNHLDDSTNIWSVPLYTLFRIKKYLKHTMGW